MGQYSFKLPDVGEGTAEAEICEWRVAVGDRVEEDQPLLDVMTDKATVELTAPVAGIVQSIAGKAGTMAAVGSVLVVLETAGESSAAAASPAPAASAPKPPVATVAAAVAAPVPAEPRAASSPVSGAAASRPMNGSSAQAGRPSVIDGVFIRPPASPAVRRRAEELGIKLQYVRGTGPVGRIVQTDLDDYLASNDAGATIAVDPLYAKRLHGEDVPVIGLRRQIAERMQAAKRHIPHFTYVEEVDMTEVESLRAHLNETRTKDQPKLTLLPFFIRALVKVLPEFPQINATYDDEAGVVHRSGAVHCGMAVQTPKGLLVSVVRHAEARDLWDCALEIARLAAAARDGKATREELSGSTITLTSLGTLGGVSATPVINRPEVAIICPNKIIKRPVVLDDDRIVVRRMMNLSSSFDHRVVDGADAAAFIQRLRTVLQQPATLFIR
ncbi:dihydrolipoamide acetyltransferase family protein [Povalibacter sp.]|uniref:dihydrolipoamide acetyltransferase family protein n=1 Tax=Povalibacter sp. TaxID=1962978 RepID=UPI002F40289B